MVITNRKIWACLVFNALFLFTLPSMIVGIQYIGMCAKAGAVDNWVTLVQSIWFVFFPFIFYQWAKEYQYGDYVVRSTTNDIFVCRNEETGEVKYVKADSIAEVDLYLEYAAPKKKFTILDSGITLESFDIHIPNRLKYEKERGNTPE